MTPKNKNLIIVDLCARLPYKVKCEVEYKEDGQWKTEDMILTGLFNDGTEQAYFLSEDGKGSIYSFDYKPYLRSLSSMTIEERKYLSDYYDWGYTCTPPKKINKDGSKTPLYIYAFQDEDFCFIHEDSAYELIDFLNEHHFDYRGLIEKGLALEAPKEMYNL